MEDRLPIVSLMEIRRRDERKEGKKDKREERKGATKRESLSEQSGAQLLLA